MTNTRLSKASLRWRGRPNRSVNPESDRFPAAQLQAQGVYHTVMPAEHPAPSRFGHKTPPAIFTISARITCRAGVPDRSSRALERSVWCSRDFSRATQRRRPGRRGHDRAGPAGDGAAHASALRSAAAPRAALPISACMRTLLAHGIVPDVIVGTSIGAVVGGCYAAGKLDDFEALGAQPDRARRARAISMSTCPGSGLIGGAISPSRLDEPRSATDASTICRSALPRSRPNSTPATRSGSRADGWPTRCARPMRCREFFRRCASAGAGWSTARWSIRCRFGRARARRAAGDRGQPQRRSVRPRHHHFRSRLRRSRR